MTQRWRLVNGVELYDMERRSRAAARRGRPAPRGGGRAARRVRGAGGPRSREQFDGTIPIPIGQNRGRDGAAQLARLAQRPGRVRLEPVLVRAGMECNGYWEIDVARRGRYRFELRRWPRLEDRPIVEGIPGELVRYSRHAARLWRRARRCPWSRPGSRWRGRARRSPSAPEDKHVDVYRRPPGRRDAGADLFV